MYVEIHTWARYPPGTRSFDLLNIPFGQKVPFPNVRPLSRCEKARILSLWFLSLSLLLHHLVVLYAFFPSFHSSCLFMRNFKIPAFWKWINEFNTKRNLFFSEKSFVREDRGSVETFLPFSLGSRVSLRTRAKGPFFSCERNPPADAPSADSFEILDGSQNALELPGKSWSDSVVRNDFDFVDQFRSLWCSPCDLFATFTISNLSDNCRIM